MVPAVSAGGFIRRNVEQVLIISSIVQTRATVLGIAGKIKKRPMKILLDSWSTGNFPVSSSLHDPTIKTTKIRKWGDVDLGRWV